MNLIIFSGLLGVIMMYCGLFIKNTRFITYIAIAAMAVLFLVNAIELHNDLPMFKLPVYGMLEPVKYGLLINQVLIGAGKDIQWDRNNLNTKEQH